MVVVSKRKATLEHLIARCVVLGDKEVGKSASIVRFTTGRFIQEYGQSTNDWLYRHSLGFDSKRNAMISLEMLEQKDIQFCSSSNFFEISTNSNNNSNNYSSNSNNNSSSSSNYKNNNTNNNDQQQQQKQKPPHQSLAYRVALDQQIDNEFYEKQQLLNKLHWADAYIVIYAVNDINTFNKAIKYLNLIANTINSPSNHHKTSTTSTTTATTSMTQHGSSSSSSGGSGTSSANSNGGNLIKNSSNSCSIGSNLNDSGVSGGKLLNKLFPSIQNHHNSSNNGLSNSIGSISISNNGNKIISPLNSHHNLTGNLFCNCNSTNSNIKRPILLLANKSDLGKIGSRQVSVADGRLLAMRHQSMFAEVSVAESNKLIENVVSNLIEQIDPACFHVDQTNYYQQQQILTENQFYSDGIKSRSVPPKITQWLPTIELTLSQSNINTTVMGGPIWGSIVKSSAIGTNVAQIGACITKSKPIEPDIRSITPLVLRAKSVETKGSLIRPMAARAILTPRDKAETPPKSSKLTVRGQSNQNLGQQHQQNHLKPINSRYENLKSSFRRASMAIVSSKALAKGSQVAKVLKEDDIKMTKNNNQILDSTEAKRNSRASSSSVPETFECYPIASKENLNNMEISRSKLESSSSIGNTPSNWFKTHIKGLNLIDRATSSFSSSDLKLNNHSSVSSTSSSGSIAGAGGGPLMISSRLKRPLLKYKNRRKTVAFEQIGQVVTDENDVGIISKPATIEYLPPIDPTNVETLKLLKKRKSDESRGSESLSSIQCSSNNRSSSSLSTIDPYYNALFVLWNNERAASSAGSICSSNYSNSNHQVTKKSSNRRNSKSTLSRASTSGGSYEESGDELSPLPKTDSKSSIIMEQISTARNALSDAKQISAESKLSTTPPCLANNCGSNINNKKRCQLVKSVQSTFTNLSKSSNVSAKAAKRSFCNALFPKNTQPLATQPLSQNVESTRDQRNTIIEVETIRPIMNMAKIETVRALPVVGFCN